MPIFRPSQVQTIENAVKQDPSIQIPLESLPTHAGFTAAYLAELGLKHTLLKKLETWGLAKRGYAPHKKGAVVRWVLINPRPADAA